MTTFQQLPGDLIATANAHPGKAWVLRSEHKGVIESCDNCDDLRYVYLFVASSGPHLGTWIVKDGRVWKAINDQWYLGNVKAFPCPVCAVEELTQLLIAQCGLVGDQRSMTIDNFKPLPGKEKALRLVKQLVCDRSGFHALYGANGRGKTHLLSAVVNDLVEHGIPARYISLPDMLAEIRAGFNENTAEEHLYQFRTVKVLCVDEPDKVNITDWTYETIFRVLSHRYNAREHLMTVLGMEINPSDLADGYLYSRLKSGIIQEVGGDDVRVVDGKKEQQRLKM